MRCSPLRYSRPPAEFEQPPWNLALAAQCVAELADVSVVHEAATTVLRQIILLIEHGISIEDRSTVALAEEEILPAIRALGDRWPGLHRRFPFPTCAGLFIQLLHSTVEAAQGQRKHAVGA